MQPIRKITRYCKRSRLLYTALIPLVVICIISGIIAAMFHKSIPHTTEKQEWVNFTKTMVIHSDQRVTLQKVTIVSLAIISQHLAGVPFMNITKILYGYWFGFLIGMALCLIMEIVCIMPIIIWAASHVRPDETLINLTSDLRNQNRFWLNLVIFQLSALPIYTRIPLILHGAVTEREFIISFYGVALVMTAKNILVGTLIYHYPKSAVVLGTVVGILTILPSVMMLYLGTSVLQSSSFWQLIGNEDREERNEEDDCDEREDGNKVSLL